MAASGRSQFSRTFYTRQSHSRLPLAIGCRDKVRGLRGLGRESRESWLRDVYVSRGLSRLDSQFGGKEGELMESDLPLVGH